MKRIWFYRPGTWTGWGPAVGSDEHGRYTLVIGSPITGAVVVPLWFNSALLADMAKETS